MRSHKLLKFNKLQASYTKHLIFLKIMFGFILGSEINRFRFIVAISGNYMYSVFFFLS